MQLMQGNITFHMQTCLVVSLFKIFVEEMHTSKKLTVVCSTFIKFVFQNETIKEFK